MQESKLFVPSPFNCFVEIVLSKAWLLSHFVRFFFSYLHLMQFFPWTPSFIPPEHK